MVLLGNTNIINLKNIQNESGTVEDISTTQIKYTEKERIDRWDRYISRTKERNYTITYENEVKSNHNNCINYDNLNLDLGIKLNYINYKELKERFYQNEMMIEKLLFKYEARYKMKYNSTIYKLIVIALTSERKSAFYRLKVDNIEECKVSINHLSNKLYYIADEGSQSIVSTVHSFIKEIEELFIKSIEIEHDAMIRRMNEEYVIATNSNISKHSNI